MITEKLCMQYAYINLRIQKQLLILFTNIKEIWFALTEKSSKYMNSIM